MLPVLHLAVQADTPREADGIAEAYGVDFNSGCDCCGPRWCCASNYGPDGSGVVETLEEVIAIIADHRYQETHKDIPHHKILSKQA